MTLSTFTLRPVTSRQKLNREIVELNNSITQMDLTDIYRTFHINTEKFTIFSVSSRSFFKINHVLGYKSSLNGYKNIKIILLRTGEIAYRSRALTTLLEVLSSIPSNHLVAHNHQPLGSNTLF